MIVTPAERSGATLTLIRGADLVAAPWKNGGGVTTEIAVEPPRAGLDDFAWRVSVANVARDGPFSRFAGVERTLVLLSGAGMVLDVEGATAHTLTHALDIARFDGDAPIAARLTGGATRDFNLMVRRAAAHGELHVWNAPTRRSVAADVMLLYCASGSVALTVDGTQNVAQPVPLASGDTLRIDAPNAALHCHVEGTGVLLAIRIRYIRRST